MDRITNRNVALALSSGLASTAYLFELLAHGNYVVTLTVDYGQRNTHEVRAAWHIAELAKQRFPDHYRGHMLLGMSSLGATLPNNCVTDVLTDAPRRSAGGGLEPGAVEVAPFVLDIIVYATAGFGVAHGCEHVALGRNLHEHHETLVERGGLSVDLLPPRFDDVDGRIVTLGIEHDAPMPLTTSCIAPHHNGFGTATQLCDWCLGCERRRRCFEAAGFPAEAAAHPSTPRT